MALIRFAAVLALTVGGVLVQATANTAEPCPACYTQTIVVDAPARTCPPLPHLPIPNPACGIVCARKARNDDKKAVTTITRPTTTTITTVTSTVPGPNPACPTTETVTMTHTIVGGVGGRAPILICPLAGRQDCACSDRPVATVEVLYTVSTTATVFMTAAPFTCVPLPTNPPVEQTVTVTREPKTPTWTAKTTLSASTCSAYTTVRESIACLDVDKRKRNEGLRAPQTTVAPVVGPSVDQTQLPPRTTTRGCKVIIIERPVICPDRGV